LGTNAFNSTGERAFNSTGERPIPCAMGGRFRVVGGHLDGRAGRRDREPWSLRGIPRAFRFDAIAPEDLREVVDELTRHNKPLVYTVPDLRNRGLMSATANAGQPCC